MLTLNDALNSMTVEDLKRLLPYLPDEKGGSRKAELIQRISNGLLGSSGEKIKRQYDQLDKWQQLAVAETLYDPAHQFFADEFNAKYQQSPAFDIPPADQARYQYYRDPSRLCLFLPQGLPSYRHDGQGLFLPMELAPLLQAFVPKPPPVKLASQLELPEADDSEVLQVRLCEQEVLTDLPLVLNLVQQGKLKASAKTGRASAVTIKLLAQELNGGDFYDTERPKTYRWSQEVGGIKAFAWPLLLQSAKLAQISGSKLELSKGGVRQLTKPTAEILRLLWQKWQKTTLLDEFRRIEAIKGQNAKGRVMTTIAPRRQTVGSALQQCPVGEWVEVDNFFSFMQAAKFHFEISHSPWKLYLGDREYGSFAYDHDWSVLQGSYVLCLLFEYAATLGIVDVAFVDPEDARDDYRRSWGTDDLDFLSRYDGLRYFRLTALGAYCLGLTDQYEPPVNTSDCSVTVLPSLHINLSAGQPNAEDQLLLDTWATQEAENSWKLDKAKTILAVERGHDIDVLQTFLQGKDDQPLPETVEGFINTCRKKGKAIKQVAVALLLECSSEEVAVTLAGHKETGKLCQRVGKKQLVVKQNQEEKFRQAARVVGFGMAL